VVSDKLLMILITKLVTLTGNILLLTVTINHTPKIRIAGIKVHLISKTVAPAIYFGFVFTTIVLYTTASETITHAHLFFQGHVTPFPNSRVRRWENIILGKIKGFIYCLFTKQGHHRKINNHIILVYMQPV
jgi:hypothetical protein